MQMKILLICKGEYRYFFPSIAHSLQEGHGADVSAIAFTTAATAMLQETQAFSSISNLAEWLKHHVPNSIPKSALQVTEALEAATGAPRINTIIHADRILS